MSAGAWRQTVIVALRAAVVTLVVTGIGYPLVVTGVALLVFPDRARGSIVVDDRGRAVGSELIGQAFVDPAYVQGRPSAAGEHGYDATASGASNWSTTSKRLRDAARADAARLRAQNPTAAGDIPVDLITRSASGLDPHVSPEAARWQAPRIARARGVAVERVRAIIDEHVEARELGLFGEPRVNVLAVNLALDRQLGRPAGRSTMAP